MKKLTLSIIVMLAMHTTVMAKSYPAYGPDSYKTVTTGQPNPDPRYGDASPAYKYDSNELNTRKGFRLGLGIGGANTSIDDLYRNEDYSETGIATTFEIGYAPSNQVSINYLNNVNWSDAEYSDYRGTFDGVSGYTALTVNYYMENAVDTAFLVGGIAYAGIDGDGETAGVIGIGYAMDNVEFEINGLFGEYNDKDMRQVFFTVSYLFF